jgi:hypothetical protein
MDSQAKEKVGVEWRWRDGGREEVARRTRRGTEDTEDYWVAMDGAVSGEATLE